VKRGQRPHGFSIDSADSVDSWCNSRCRLTLACVHYGVIYLRKCVGGGACSDLAF
jgi:hypothetical protein